LRARVARLGCVLGSRPWASDLAAGPGVGDLGAS